MLAIIGQFLTYINLLFVQDGLCFSVTLKALIGVWGGRFVHKLFN